ncbi:MAG: hypothetical protein WCC95_18220 [Candidatus Sulfotelmatobacter sp.]
MTASDKRVIGAVVGIVLISAILVPLAYMTIFYTILILLLRPFGTQLMDIVQVSLQWTVIVICIATIARLASYLFWKARGF